MKTNSVKNGEVEAIRDFLIECATKRAADGLPASAEVHRQAADLIKRLWREKETTIQQLIETKEYYRSRLATEDHRVDELQARIEELEREVYFYRFGEEAVSDPKDRLKQWGEDGYIDADLRNTFKDSLARIKELESAILVYQTQEGDSWLTSDAAIQSFLEDYEDVLAVTMRRQKVKGEK